MSAYGAIKAPQGSGGPLPVLSYKLPGDLVLTTHPVQGADAPQELIDYLFDIFNKEIEEGKTYPQEDQMTREQFVAYFFNSTTIVAIVSPASVDVASLKTLEDARAGRSWEEVVGGVYYIKPNYPGRSSHNCNAGFIVPPSQRGRKVGYGLAESFLVYAPKLGYKSSVFNLVYSNNVASLKLWDKLGFSRVGLIPKAGRLRTGPNGAEEYVDAVVVYKSFE
ncbi:L-azetidine-2-carboxylic acid acetyltransferase [Vanrija pseudolonga]|uniref:L-azetidine-2-carboxylic acid acetyltransferase n=1 Tax=Vanrija pseudolonga TaxID=143232 RepID=A0AAF1BHI8_9TREE|nr:L-azetidine-2-carboxylic acid acetyltransferase [Vanrija pseudolonga]